MPKTPNKTANTVKGACRNSTGINHLKRNSCLNTESPLLNKKQSAHILKIKAKRTNQNVLNFNKTNKGENVKQRKKIKMPARTLKVRGV